jgi:imidazolonepropionase-like amidohydrolase
MAEAGMPVMEILKAATVTNAGILDLADTLGQLREGFLADIVAVEANPLDDVATLKNVLFVMKEGEVYKSQ